MPVDQPARVGKVPLAGPELVRSLVFGAEKWESYFGEVGAEPPLPSDIAAILTSPCPIWPGKTVGETHKLVLVPQTVDGIPLTLDLMGELIQRPRQGQATKYNYYPDYLKEALRSTSSPAHWILMMKDVIPASRCQTYPVQQAQLAALLEGYQVPRLLEAAACMLIEHVETGTHLFSGPLTYTRCQEMCGGSQAVVGGFTAEGLYIYSSVDNATCGVAGLRIF